MQKESVILLQYIVLFSYVAASMVINLLLLPSRCPSFSIYVCLSVS